MVKLGLDTHSYHLRLGELGHREGTPWFLERITDLGFQGCHFDARYLQGWNEDCVREIGRHCEKRGLYLELGSGGYDYDRLASRLKLASEVGAVLVRTFVGRDRFTVSEERRTELISSITRNLRRLAEVAEKHRVTLALENHRDLTCSEIARVLNDVDSPYVRAYMDTGNTLPLWEDPLTCVLQLAPRLASAHLKDWKHWWEEGVSVWKGCPLGHGDVGIAAIYPVLREIDPNMPIVLKVITSSSDTPACSIAVEEANVAESVKFVRELEARMALTDKVTS